MRQQSGAFSGERGKTGTTPARVRDSRLASTSGHCHLGRSMLARFEPSLSATLTQKVQ